jgi:PIN domain nuclease of toxin-antitoxin system
MPARLREMFVAHWRIRLELPISVQHGQATGSLPGPRRDPFDRMLVAQATLADLVLVSNEAVFDR